jgi:hypothetical protein
MAEASPIASLTQALPAALQIRPPGPSRTASSRSLGRASVSSIQLVVYAHELPQEISEGVKELARTAIRNNVRVLEQDGQEQQRHGAQGGVSGTTWLVRSVPALAGS